MAVGNPPASNAIVVCCTESWLPYAACALLSCARHAGALEVDYHVICLPCAQSSIDSFAAFLEAKGVSPKIHIATVPQEFAAIDMGRYTFASLLRLLLDKHVPHHYERLLYLDCDVLACASLAGVFSLDLTGKALGAVEDYLTMHAGQRYRSAHFEELGVPQPDRYFNSGVMLFDWKQTVAKGLLPRSAAEIATHCRNNRAFPLHDQDALNIAFREDWAPIALAFNVTDIDYTPSKPVVFRHYTTRVKPWGETWIPGFGDAKARYAKLLAGGPWPKANAPFRKVWLAETLRGLGHRLRNGWF
ncbi:MAG: glycosyltransferase family 8 protein [Alphaproteobacteria bacterium]|nr:glycosyltransferase family 8 protein [Alphaproteobacteria bacterium]